MNTTELRDLALDDKVPVSTLLRHALSVATDLDDGEFIQWIQAELRGYPNGDAPGYRITTGEIVEGDDKKKYAINIPDRVINEAAREVRIINGVPELERFMSTPTKGLAVRLDSRFEEYIRASTGTTMQIGAVVPISRVVGVLQSIRDEVHQWAVKNGRRVPHKPAPWLRVLIFVVIVGGLVLFSWWRGWIDFTSVRDNLWASLIYDVMKFALFTLIAYVFDRFVLRRGNR